jgi:hypothetical protein
VAEDRENQGSQQKQVYSPHDVAVRLGISTAALRRLAQAYERTFGELARDSRFGRVWPQEALDRLRRARTAVQDGRYVSVELALRAIADGGGIEAMPARAGTPEDAGQQLLNELRALREAVDWQNRLIDYQWRRTEALNEAPPSAVIKLRPPGLAEKKLAARVNTVDEVADRGLDARKAVVTDASEGATNDADAKTEIIATEVVEAVPDDATDAKTEVATVAVQSLEGNAASKAKAEILNEIMKTMTRPELSLWQYVVGILLTVAAVGWDEFWDLRLFMSDDYVILSALPLSAIVPLIFGFWVGLTRRLERLHWPSVGAVALVLAIGALSITFAVDYSMGKENSILVPQYWSIPIRGLVPALLFMSGAILGNALLRRVFGVAAFQRESDSVDTNGAGRWTPRQQATLGFVGVLLSALIPAFATVVSAVMGNGN